MEEIRTCHCFTHGSLDLYFYLDLLSRFSTGDDEESTLLGLEEENDI